MLSLGRNPGEYVVINDNIIVMVAKVGSHLRLTIDAPKDMEVIRGEIYEKNNPIPKSILKMQNKSGI